MATIYDATSLPLTLDPDLSVSTDKADYSPGAVAAFTVEGAAQGSTLDFVVAHLNAGADGEYGTADDFLTYDLAGTGVIYAASDADDGVLDGKVSINWLVNADAADQHFEVFAIDSNTGMYSSALFTDAGPNEWPNTFVYTATPDVVIDMANTALNVVDPITLATPRIAVGNGALLTNLPFGNVSGSGGFNPMARIQNTGQEEGYNSTATASEHIVFQGTDQLNVMNNNASFNPIVLLSSLGNVLVDNKSYYEFTLDSNQVNSRPILSIDSFIVYQSTHSDLGTTAALGYQPPTEQGGTGAGFGANATQVYNLDSGGVDRTIMIDSGFR